MNFFNFFKKEKEDLQFIDITEDSSIYSHFPPILAKNVKPFIKEIQENVFGSYDFPGCPGMHDYSRIGYIIPAWTDFHIKANKAGHIAIAGCRGEDFLKRIPPVGQPLQMDPKMTHGMFEIKDNIEPCSWNFPSPWRVQAKQNLSALVMPALYHSTFLDDLYVYPGIIDYNNFHILNFICSPKRACEVEIKAGSPLLHVIPFYTNKTIVASYGPGNREMKDAMMISPRMWEHNFYRKYFMIKKRFKISKKVEE